MARLLTRRWFGQGYAHAYTEFPFKYVHQFLAFEREAREAGRGLWADSPTPTTQAAALPSIIGERYRDCVCDAHRENQYHRAGCSYLARSQIPIPLRDVAGHYTAVQDLQTPDSAANE